MLLARKDERYATIANVRFDLKSEFEMEYQRPARHTWT